MNPDSSQEIVHEAWAEEYRQFLMQDEFDNFADYIFNKYPYPE